MFELSIKYVCFWYILTLQQIVRCEIEYNTINEDGSFSFRHKNDDIGGYYHSASGSPDNNVRGRYGSRNPATGQVEEVVYSAGPRGFRVNGPKIHRKMDLAQFPVLPRGSPDDPLADPFDDPTYSFQFRTGDQSRTEDNDATGRVRGLYSYLDDVGERHSVRYAAGAGTGFEVSNSVPDSPVIVSYAAPLYKAHPQTRGKMSVQRGPGGSYKLIAAGPDHRRAESREPDGLVRGTYSYLDDTGIQRTVEYIAGAGIGYRVVQNSVGPGSHINPSVGDYRLNDADFKLANNFGRGAGGGLGSGGGRKGGVADGEFLKTAGSGRIRPNDINDDDEAGGAIDAAADGDGSLSGDIDSNDENVDGDKAADFDIDSGSRSEVSSAGKSDRMGSAAGRRGGTRYNGGATGSRGKIDASGERDSSTISGRRGPGSKLGGTGGKRPSSNRNTVAGERGGAANRNRIPSRNGIRNRDDSISVTDTRLSSKSSSSATRNRGNGINTPFSTSLSSTSTSDNNYNLNDDDVGSLPPLITANRKILEIDRERDWVERHRDSTVIKNVGKWYIGLPPGQGVRAHVQNIDLLPLGGRRIPSPSEALRQDELADMVASYDSGSGPTGMSAYRGS